MSRAVYPLNYKEKYPEKQLVSHKHRVRIYHHRFNFYYKTTIERHLLTIGLVIAGVIILSSLVFHFSTSKNSFDINQIAPKDIITAIINSLIRMFVSYAIALVISVPLALLVMSTSKVTKVLLPIADVLQSVPVLAFFPIVVTFFTFYNQFELAAIFILVTIMIWNIVFAAIQGINTIPEDIESAAFVFNVKGFKKYWYVILPAIVPALVIGSLDAWAQGWTAIIVAEVLHTYIPHGNPSQDLLGLGSLLVDSNAAGKNTLFLVTLAILILIVALINLFVWQRLIHLSQRFRFD